MNIKIISLNIFIGGLFMDAVLEFIHQERPDILLLQEAYHGTDEGLKRELRTIQTLQAEFQYLYAAFSPAFMDINKDFKVQQGNAIISDFPIVTHNTTFFDRPYKEIANYLDRPQEFPDLPRNFQHGVINVQNKMINVFNTQGIWGTDGNDNERRLQMADAIANAVAGKDKAILAGDFNVKEGTESVAKIEKHMTNVFKGDLTSSFNLRVKDPNIFGSAVVDMMFVSPDIKVVEKRVPDIDVSDHLPLIAVLDIS